MSVRDGRRPHRPGEAARPREAASPGVAAGGRIGGTRGVVRRPAAAGATGRAAFAPRSAGPPRGAGGPSRTGGTGGTGKVSRGAASARPAGPADPQPGFLVHLQCGDRRPAGRGGADDQRPRPPKMLLPSLRTRVKQRCHAAGPTVHARQVRPLVQVAPPARQREVRRVIGAVVLNGPHVVDLVRDERGVSLRQSAVFAPVSGAVPDEGAGRRVDHPLSPAPPAAARAAPAKR